LQVVTGSGAVDLAAAQTTLAGVAQLSGVRIKK
jgi:hypothetical protein